MAGRAFNKVIRYSNCRPSLGRAGFTSLRRSFTTSPARQKHGVVPVFKEASTPELQTLLTTVRNTVFLPAQLSKQHQALIYSAKRSSLLELDPVRVDIGGEPFRLTHVNRLRDQPGTAATITTFLSSARDRNDWSNLPSLLTGFTSSGRQLKRPLQEKMVRRAGMAGMQGVIVECVRQATRTGFVLRELNLVREVVWWLQYKPMMRGWEAKSTKKALGLAEQVAALLEDEKHCGGSLGGPLDPRARPEVVGVLLELAAKVALQDGGKDTDGKVKTYALRLLGTLGRKAEWTDGLEARTKPLWMSGALAANLAPVVRGMRDAIEVLGPDSDVSLKLKVEEEKLSTLAAEQREILAKGLPEGAASLGATCYDKLLGPASV